MRLASAVANADASRSSSAVASRVLLRTDHAQSRPVNARLSISTPAGSQRKRGVRASATATAAPAASHAAPRLGRLLEKQEGCMEVGLAPTGVCRRQLGRFPAAARRNASVRPPGLGSSSRRAQQDVLLQVARSFRCAGTFVRTFDSRCGRKKPAHRPWSQLASAGTLPARRIQALGTWQPSRGADCPAPIRRHPVVPFRSRHRTCAAARARSPGRRCTTPRRSPAAP